MWSGKWTAEGIEFSAREIPTEAGDVTFEVIAERDGVSLPMDGPYSFSRIPEYFPNNEGILVKDMDQGIKIAITQTVTEVAIRKGWQR